MSNLNVVKSEMQSRIIRAYNDKFFKTEELVRVQDEIDAVPSVERMLVVIRAHHDRVRDSFDKAFSDNITAVFDHGV